MANDSGYLKPKVSMGGAGELKKKKRGMFMNHPPYPELGGFSSASKLPKAENMALERGRTFGS